MSNDLDHVEVKNGVALIINNHTFWNKNFKNKSEIVHRSTRNGSEKDVEKLENLLKNFGFTVLTPVIDGTEVEIKEEAKKLADYLVDTQNYDFVLVVVMTHGHDEGCLLDKNSELYRVQDIWEPFLPVKHIPKVFIFQSCRGGNSDMGQKVSLAQAPELGSQRPNLASQTSLQDCKKRIVTPKRVSIIPNMHDVLVAYATIEGFYSWRDTYEGSYFVESFVNAVNENETNGKVELTDVFKSTARLLADVPIVPNLNECRQTSTFVSSFTNKYVLVKPSQLH